MYDGSVELLPGAPGTAGLTALPPPDLANPAGGAVEPQHFAYIIQWYLFAALAVAAPFAMARAERRELEASGPEHTPRPEPASDGPAAMPELHVDLRTDAQRRAAKLADRYGRPVH